MFAGRARWRPQNARRDGGLRDLVAYHQLALGSSTLAVDSVQTVFSSALGSIRAREVEFNLHLTFVGSPDLSLPAYDSSLQIPHVTPAH